MSVLKDASGGANASLRRRMCRILMLMLEGGAVDGRYHGELVKQRGRWYVATTTVNPAAAQRLLQLGLVREVLNDSSRQCDDSCRCYELSETARIRIAQQLSSERTPQRMSNSFAQRLSRALSRRDGRQIGPLLACVNERAS